MKGGVGDATRNSMRRKSSKKVFIGTLFVAHHSSTCTALLHQYSSLFLPPLLTLTGATEALNGSAGSPHQRVVEDGQRLAVARVRVQKHVQQHAETVHPALCTYVGGRVIGWLISWLVGWFVSAGRRGVQVGVREAIIWSMRSRKSRIKYAVIIKTISPTNSV